MELIAPGGNPEKLLTAFRYGADAAYLGLKDFSLRRQADNFSPEEGKEIGERADFRDRKIYLALNIYFNHAALEALKAGRDALAGFRPQGFIISDLGLLPFLKRSFPQVPLHLSTQANCLNKESAEVYRDLGFSRIILGRETPLDEMARIKAALPELELECFVHGAMCLAYSGRCYLSRYLTGRSANQGDCAQSCRWEYRVLEEAKRPGEYFPLETGPGWTTLLSSRDLCLIDHLGELKSAGIDALKIEGRMKSVFYTALVTQAYRKHLDALEKPPGEGPGKEELARYREDLHSISHRPYGTGFLFPRGEEEEPAPGDYLRTSLFLGSLLPHPQRAEGGGWLYRLELKNKLYPGEEVEFITPQERIATTCYGVKDETGAPVGQADQGKPYTLEIPHSFPDGCLLRRSLHGEEK
ncbi:MAG: U32 family peptidase [Spirochaetales bacterium]|jgi:putative protease|nr:U32 family peptidase [Spirochaetales bacterium]